jgi:hypothetical protein
LSLPGSGIARSSLSSDPFTFVFFSFMVLTDKRCF